MGTIFPLFQARGLKPHSLLGRQVPFTYSQQFSSDVLLGTRVQPENRQLWSHPSTEKAAFSLPPVFEYVINSEKLL